MATTENARRSSSATLILFAASSFMSLFAYGPFGLETVETAAALDETWMAPGHTFTYQTLSTMPTIEYKVVVHSTDSAYITLDWGVTYYNGEHDSRRETYVKADRLSASESGYYSDIWVNQADIDAGQAWIGDTFTILVTSNLLYYQFSSGSRNFFFDAAGGYLQRAEDLDSGSMIVLVSSEP